MKNTVRKTLGGALLIFLLFTFACSRKEPPVSSNEVQAILKSSVPSSIEAPEWREVPVYNANLILQDLVEPRLLAPSTLQLKVQAITDGNQVAFLLQWEDPTENRMVRPAMFSDACAIQFPVKLEPDLPAPQMGEEGRPVEISYWSASAQDAAGREDKIQELYPWASVDHYPFEAPSLKKGSPEQQEMEKRYSPARAANNTISGPKRRAVEDLIAEGPGTLRPAEKNISNGLGKRTEKGWSVLIWRPLPAAMRNVTQGQVAFAVWEGSHQEVGARKMRTAWIPLALEKKS